MLRLAILNLALLGVLTLAIPIKADEEVELRFKSDPTCNRTVLRLGDLVEVTRGQNSSTKAMMEITLGPAPRPGATQTWFQSDVQQHLELRGFHANGIRWLGEQQTRVQRVDRLIEMELGTTVTPAFLDERRIRQAEGNVALAIADYLSLKTGERADWQVEAFISNQYVSSLQVRTNITGIGGGNPPWTGKQRFAIEVKHEGQIIALPIDATVSLPPMVVVASRPLRRDEVLDEKALTFKALGSKFSKEAHYFHDLSELVGKQMRRSLSTGLPLTAELVGDPVVVSRGEIVTVESVAGGVVVSSQAKSLSAGAVGDSVQVELPTRDKVYATVVSPLVVRIAAIPAHTGP
ncbi:MAG: flagellar basal body P-ring formation protein FlgA [Planctomycetales bacterium]|nr:flagellar basal body P-ring formation protein FlgA [Planctomycetales bacterium]